MWLRKVELRHVRHLKELSLNLSGPLTLIGGPLGGGKTTCQTAILAAMFSCDKKTRDSLVSRFDPHSPPLATLELSRSNSECAILLTRCLTDDSGEWKEGATTTKQKGKALAKVQESLPICANAAALLLWALQDTLTDVIDSFPSDGHSLLTAATIRGSGPDPKKVVEDLEGDFKNAKKGGKDPGPLTRADDQVKLLDGELKLAEEAQKKLGQLKEILDRAKTACTQAQKLRDDTKNEIKRLTDLETLVDIALKAKGELSELEEKQDLWKQLEGDIAAAQEIAKQQEQELGDLQSQFRVAKDKELREEATKLGLLINAVEEADEKQNGFQKRLDEKKRPDKADQDEYSRLEGVRREAEAGLKATGVRYALSVHSGSRTVEVCEDHEAAKQVHLAAGVIHEGVVGAVAVLSEDLRFAAAGKGDITSLKRSVEEASAQIAKLFKLYGVSGEEEFTLLREEKDKLQKDFAKAERDVEKELKGATLASLKADLKLKETAREENDVSQLDLETCRGKHVGTSAEIDKKLTRKDADIENGNKELKKLQRNLPKDTERSKHDQDIKTARRKAEALVAEFKETDEAKREPSGELLAEIREALRKARATLSNLLDPQKNPENELTRLSTELKYSGPERPIPSVQSELEEAKSILHREQVLQAGRELLKQRIQTKINEMTAEVPRELGNRISQNLASLTRGVYAKLMLTEDLSVTTIGEGNGTAEHWEPHQLSHGERHVTALAIKIAVARSLADLSGPVFVILDDSLVTFDPDHRERTERLLMDLVADGKLQVILLTCHTDWATDWKKRAGDRLQYIELAKIAKYYRPPIGVALSSEEKCATP